jgi:predicted enzyme related to lactoylglutathione lyase
VRCAATVYVSRLDQMRAFYEACFGMALVDLVAGDYCVPNSHAWTLSLVVAHGASERAADATRPPVRREQTPIKLTFDVPSIDEVRPVIDGLGGSVDPAAGEWEFRGFRHIDGLDPEGNVLQLRTAVATA